MYGHNETLVVSGPRTKLPSAAPAYIASTAASCEASEGERGGVEEPLPPGCIVWVFHLDSLVWIAMTGSWQSNLRTIHPLILRTCFLVPCVARYPIYRYTWYQVSYVSIFYCFPFDLPGTACCKLLVRRFSPSEFT